MVDAVVLIAFGGPTERDEIRPFLANVTRGRHISTERLEEVVHHYERMPGGRSPLNDLTLAQSRALGEALSRRGTLMEVRVGMRNWRPYLHETLAQLAGRGVRRCLGLIMSSLRCEASWERYQQDVAEARARMSDAPEVVFAPPWSREPGFIDALVDRAGAALRELPEDGRRWAPLIFTAHSIPVAMADASPYVEDFTAVARAVATKLDHARWSLAYQSRSGRPEDAWLEPDVNTVVRSLARDGERHAVVVPVGFVCDHVEVLYDLDVEAVENARAQGLNLHRAATVGDHPAFIAGLADLVVNAA
ncbi:MAG TPA: ferrochelatase [Candidatus Acidoferrum sp.]|nr:ferrochelatase [Candidatus Acidoferrum sp.]